MRQSWPVVLTHRKICLEVYLPFEGLGGLWFGHFHGHNHDLNRPRVSLLGMCYASKALMICEWTNAIASKCGDNCAVNVQFSIAKWIFVGCIIFSFLLVSHASSRLCYG